MHKLAVMAKPVAPESEAVGFEDFPSGTSTQENGKWLPSSTLLANSIQLLG